MSEPNHPGQVYATTLEVAQYSRAGMSVAKVRRSALYGGIDLAGGLYLSQLPEPRPVVLTGLILVVQSPSSAACAVSAGYSSAPPLPPPAGLTVTPSASGGSLAGGTTVAYRVAAVGPGGSSLACAEVSAVVPAGSTGSAALAWSAVAGAQTYSVYGRTAGAEQLVASGLTGLTYTDAGSVVPAGALPAGVVTSLISGQSVAAAGAFGWSGYQSLTPGAYLSASTASGASAGLAGLVLAQYLMT